MTETQSYKKLRLDKYTTRDEHRFVMEKHLGRKLLPSEVVHHKDGNKRNNNLNNLELMSLSEHTKLEYKLGNLHKFTRADTLKGTSIAAKKRKLPHDEEHYTCSRCRKLKHFTAFHKNKSKWNGLAHNCKECMKYFQNKN